MGLVGVMEVEMTRRRHTPELKAEVVLEVLAGDKTEGQIAGSGRCTPELGRALEAALHRAGAGDRRRGDDGQRMRASAP